MRYQYFFFFVGEMFHYACVKNLNFNRSPRVSHLLDLQCNPPANPRHSLRFGLVDNHLVNQQLDLHVIQVLSPQGIHPGNPQVSHLADLLHNLLINLLASHQVSQQ